jgi:hypothetical protein
MRDHGPKKLAQPSEHEPTFTASGVLERIVVAQATRPIPPARSLGPSHGIRRESTTSVLGTNRTSRDVRSLVAIGSKPDMVRTGVKNDMAEIQRLVCGGFGLIGGKVAVHQMYGTD